MKITSFNKLTLLDYPEHIACLIFTQGCNLNCPFCQNSSLIPFEGEERVDEIIVLDYLEKRKNVLEGLCISGGEPLMQKGLESFITKVKALGYKVKLDTNGTNPNELKNLLDKNLLDYVAMDIKNSFNNYGKTCGIIKMNTDNIKESINLLINSNIDYEFRTTMVKELHNLEDIKQICQYIGKQSKYFLQNYVDSDHVLKKGLHGFSEEELIDIKNILEDENPNLKIRGSYIYTN